MESSNGKQYENKQTTVDKTICKKNAYNFENMSSNGYTLSNDQTGHKTEKGDAKKFASSNWLDEEIRGEESANLINDEDDEEHECDVYNIDEDIENIKTFDDLNLHDDILRAMMIEGFENPTNCQKLTRHLQSVTRKFVAINAKTGKGKTIMAFLIAISKILNINEEQEDENTGDIVKGVDFRDQRSCQALILTCTRVLAKQFYDDIVKFCTHLGISVAMHRGTFQKNSGAPVMKGDRNDNINCLSNVKELYKNGKIKSDEAIIGREQIVIGTRGKLIQIMRPETFEEGKSVRLITEGGRNFEIRSAIDVTNVRTVVIDEADSFADDMNNSKNKDGADAFSFGDFMGLLETTIIQDGVEYKIGPENIYFMSATLQKTPEFFNDMLRLGCYIHPAARFFVPFDIDNIEKVYYPVPDEPSKIHALVHCLKHVDGLCLIFFNSNETCSAIYDKLLESEYPVGICAGDMSINEKDDILKRFSKGEIKFLCSSGGLSRGVDIPSLQNVINYDIPSTIALFDHQNGRCARQSRTGRSTTLVVHNGSNNVPPKIVALMKGGGHVIKCVS